MGRILQQAQPDGQKHFLCIHLKLCLCMLQICAGPRNLGPENNRPVCNSELEHELEVER